MKSSAFIPCLFLLKALCNALVSVFFLLRATDFSCPFCLGNSISDAVNLFSLDLRSLGSQVVLKPGFVVAGILLKMFVLIIT